MGEKVFRPAGAVLKARGAEQLCPASDLVGHGPHHVRESHIWAVAERVELHDHTTPHAKRKGAEAGQKTRRQSSGQMPAPVLLMLPRGRWRALTVPTTTTEDYVNSVLDLGRRDRITCDLERRAQWL